MIRKAFPWLAGAAIGGLGWLAYGALVGSKKIAVERRRLSLPRWPASKDGFRIALLADFHIRDEYSIEMTQRAIRLALAEAPDVMAIAGDLVAYWKLTSPWQLEEALRGLEPVRDRVVVIPGNHEYWGGDSTLLVPICEELGFTLLRNESTSLSGVTWVGVDSGIEGRGRPTIAMEQALVASGEDPIVVLWHEPDFVDMLPPGAALMLSGHSHGGQWRFPWGWTPMHTRGGERYVDGFYPSAPTPLYVTRGIGTTGPPARLGALAEVSILELYHG